jgi:EPS-associated MarR family transcriptional regulator
MGISLGKVNYCISELAAKGWIKITRFRNAGNKIPYTYMLTPKGLEEKGKLNIRFLKRKVAEYEETKKQIMELAREADKESSEDISPEDILEILNVIS